MRQFLVSVVLSGLALSAYAVPTVGEVEAEVARGNYVQAESMMREVVAAKPGSARAHYIYAEILAHDAHFDRAAEEAATARRLDPSLRFAPSDKVRAFEQLLQREQAAAARTLPAQRSEFPAARAPMSPAPSSGLPGWAWGLGLAALGLIAWRIWGARRTLAPAAAYPVSAGSLYPAGGPVAAQGYGPGYGPGYAPGPSGGSGLLGTGLAVAGGVAAGMLAEKLFEGHREQGNFGGAGLGGVAPDNFGAARDDSAERELEQRPIDFGNGDGWGDDGGSAGGSSDGDGGW
jgi:hypothetical protein